MTFKTMIDTINKTLNIREDDINSISIIKNSINEAYMLLCKEDKRLTRAYVPIINGIATIPANSIGILKTVPKLDRKDTAYGNSIVTDKTGVLEMLYFYTREALIEDNEEFDLHPILQQAIINYVCGLMSISKGDTSDYNYYIQAYDRNVSQFEQVDIAVSEGIVEVEY